DGMWRGVGGDSATPVKTPGIKMGPAAELAVTKRKIDQRRSSDKRILNRRATAGGLIRTMLVVRHRHKLAAFQVVSKYFSRLDLVNPSMQVQIATRQPGRYGRKRPEILQLDEHILLNGSGQQSLAVQMAVVRLDNAPSALGIGQPGRQGGQRREFLRMEQPSHCPAMGVSADDDVFHTQRRDGEFNSCRLPAARGTVGWDNVPGVAKDEQVARLGAS